MLPATVSVVILNYNDAETSIDCAHKYLTSNLVREVIIVDNLSTDNSSEELEKFASRYPNVTFVQSARNGGYGAGNNLGLQHARKQAQTDATPLVLISNPDAYADDAAIAGMMKCFAEQQNCIICAPCQVDSMGVPITKTSWSLPGAWLLAAEQSLILRKLFLPKSAPAPRERFKQVDCVSGALLMVDANKFSAIGNYDEKIFLYYEETSVGLRARRHGFQTFLDQGNTYIHGYSKTISRAFPSVLKRKRLFAESLKTIVEQEYPTMRFLPTAVTVFGALATAELWLLVLATKCGIISGRRARWFS